MSAEKVLRAIQKHEGFWNRWVLARTYPLAPEIYPDEECKAAEDLWFALNDVRKEEKSD